MSPLIHLEDFNKILKEVHQSLVLHQASIATAESCTAGLLSFLLTTIPGSSQYFFGSIVAYSNEAKSTLLGVSGELIASHGAVSKEVALAMAQGARKRLGVSYGLSITGIAGPDGGSKEKPVGTIWLGLSSETIQVIT